MRLYVKPIVCCVLFCFALAGCQSNEPEPGGPTGGHRGPIGKADDLTGSCIDAEVEYCGGPSAGTCWCDELCAGYGDCCLDAADVCRVDECLLGDEDKCPEGYSCMPGMCYHYCLPEDPGCCAPNECVEDPEPQRCGPFPGGTCPDGYICNLETCAVGGSGECVPKLDFIECPAVGMPVCGCDGRTYHNDCKRIKAGVAKDHDGPCEQTCGPFPGGFCGEGQTCDIRSCALGATGQCRPTPCFCAEIYAPVCGCNGVTYSNDCHRVQAGAMLDHEGPCEPQTCGPYPGGQCPEGYICDIRTCALGGSGECIARPENAFCGTEYEPVCGCNGVTYQNECFRLNAGMSLDHEGEC